MFFRRAKKAAPAMVEVTPEHLEYIPRRPDAVEVREDSQGHVHLRITRELQGVAKQVAARLKYDYTNTYELDEFGTYYYAQVDGRTNLKVIIDRMIARFDREPTEVVRAVAEFTKHLMIKQLLELLPPAGHTSEES